MDRYTKEILEEAVRSSKSIAGVMRHLGLTGISGGMHAHLKNRIAFFNISTKHFVRHNKGIYVPRKETSEWLILHRGIYKPKSRRLRRAMIESGIPNLCAKCGVGDVWNGTKLVLQIEHKNGNSKDCRKENLEFLCPNCHSQTPTWAKIKRKQAGVAELADA